MLVRPPIQQNESNVLHGLSELVEKYQAQAMDRNALSQSKKARADYIQKKWLKILEGIKKEVDAKNIQLPLNYALLELKRLMRDPILQQDKSSQDSLKAYLLAYHQYLKEKAKEEFDEFQKQAREAILFDRHVDYVPTVKARNLEELVELLPKEAIETTYQKVIKTDIQEGRYKPSQVYTIGLQALHRDLTYVGPLEADKHYIIAQAPGHEFHRADGKVIKYFYPVRDIDLGSAKTSGEPMLSQWVKEFGKKIKPNEMIIIPLLQDKRRHFNTIVIYKKKIYMLEPRATNLAREGLRPYIYPSEAIGKTLQKALGPDYQFENIFVDHQSLFNDVDCGAHQLNYTELLYTLPDATLRDSEKLQEALQPAQMAHRKNDEDAIIRSAFLRSQYDASHPDLQIAEEVKQAVSEEDIEFELAEKGEIKFDVRKEKNMQQATHAVLTETQGHKCKRDIAIAVEQMQAYIDYAKAHPGLFRPRTRVETASFLMKYAGSLELQNREDRLKLSLLFVATYQSLGGSSKLRKYIEKSLVRLLDCENEYTAIKNNSLSIPRDINLLFAHRLRAEAQLLKGQFISQYQHSFNTLLKAMEKMDEIDTSFSNKDIQHQKRVPVFERVQTAMDSLTVESSPRMIYRRNF